MCLGCQYLGCCWSVPVAALNVSLVLPPTFSQVPCQRKNKSPAEQIGVGRLLLGSKLSLHKLPRQVLTLTVTLHCKSVYEMIVTKQRRLLETHASEHAKVRAHQHGSVVLQN